MIKIPFNEEDFALNVFRKLEPNYISIICTNVLREYGKFNDMRYVEAIYVEKTKITISTGVSGMDYLWSTGATTQTIQINKAGTTVIMATHDAGIVDQMRKRVIEITGGAIIRDQAQGVYGYS